MNVPSTTRRAGSSSFRCVALVLVAVLALGFSAPSTRGESLASQLVKTAPEVVRYMNREGYRNVGVLKFRIQKGDGKLTDSAGTLNSTLADRVETSLMLALDAKVKDPMGIIDDASAVAASLGNASYLTEAGRKQLFGCNRYPLHWGDKKVAADAFVTGVVVLPRERASMEVALCVLDKKGKMHFFEAFEADLNTNLMTETGRDFLILRGFGDSGKRKTQPLSTQLARKDSIKQQASKTPVVKTEGAPVELIVCYDGKPVPFDLGPDKTATIPEPREGQKVHFELVRHDTSDTRYGVVLKVNGENTMFKQKLPALECRKWILDPEQQRTEIHGYQLDDREREDFRIASPAESKEMEVNYRPDVGQISMVVFREEQVGGPPPEDLPPDEAPAPSSSTETVLKGPSAKTLLAASFGKVGSKPNEDPPETLLAAQRRARDNANSVARLETRGLILSGGITGSSIRQVSFKPDPIPVMLATVTYYKP